MAKHSVYVYRFYPSDGSLVLLNIQGEASKVVNPAFSRYHPRLNVVYTCTEEIENNGKIFAYKLGPNGEMEQLGDAVDAGGTSTCYLTIDKAQKNMLAVNYWDSTLVVIPIDQQTGELVGPIQSTYDPKGGKGVVAAAKKKGGVNHSCNDESTIQMRQKDPHSHALVLDPYVGTVAYVPCLGKDLIREFYYNPEGRIEMVGGGLPDQHACCVGHLARTQYCISQSRISHFFRCFSSSRNSMYFLQDFAPENPTDHVIWSSTRHSMLFM
jgi:6-phosphogluconolactonase